KLALQAPKNSPQARALHDQALKLYQGVEQGDNEFSTQAHESKLNVILQFSQERPIGKLQDFPECYMRALLEVARINEESKKLKGSDLEAKRKEHFHNMLEALNRGLDLTDHTTLSDEV